MKYQNIIFDLGNVLLRWEPCDVIAKCFPNSEDHQQYFTHMFAHDDWIRWDQGLITEEEAMQRFASRLSLSQEDIIKLKQTIRESLQPMPQMVQLAQQLYDNNTKLFCITNASDEVFTYQYRNRDFWHVFTDIIVSGRIKMIKPDHEIFHYAIKTFQIDPEKSLFIDDTLANIEAAKACGLDGYHLDKTKDCSQELLFKLEI